MRNYAYILTSDLTLQYMVLENLYMLYGTKEYLYKRSKLLCLTYQLPI